MKTSKKAGPAGRRERRDFSPEFKAEAVRMVAERRALGVSLTQIGRELDVRPDQLRGWVKQGRRDPASALPGESVEQENRRLRREVAVLRQEQAFAKKVAVDSMGQRNSAPKRSAGMSEYRATLDMARTMTIGIGNSIGVGRGA